MPGALIPTLFFLAGASSEVRAIEILWQRTGDVAPQAGAAHVTVQDDVELSLLVSLADGTCACRTGHWLDAHGQDHVCERRLEELSEWRVHWWLLKPSAALISRSLRGEGAGFGFQRKTYAETRLHSVALVDSGTLSAGTHRWVAEMDNGTGTKVRTARDEHLDDAWVLRVRASDRFSGILQETSGVPEVVSPRGAPPERHETQLGLGADFDSRVIYTARRMGKTLAYLPLERLDERTFALVHEPWRDGDVASYRTSRWVLMDENGDGQVDGALVWRDLRWNRASLTSLPAGVMVFRFQGLARATGNP